MCGLAATGFCRPALTKFSFPKTVDVFDCYEIAFSMNTYDNPYDPEVIRAYAKFDGPNGQTYTVEAFYYEGYLFQEHKKSEIASRNKTTDGWRIRFTPDAPGKWTFTVTAADNNGKVLLNSYQGKAFEFQCLAKENADGFIRQANTRYLKRETFVEGQKQYRSFYPVGPNIAWYASSDYEIYSKPYGIYDYERYVDSLTGNANYMRVWINRYQYLSLYGPEHALKENGVMVNYFDSKLNQKDAAELDHIINYADSHGINVMLNIFNFGDFRNDSEGVANSAKNGSMPSAWMYNPYHTIMGLQRPVDFFTDPEAKRISKNLIRYIVSRWGYSTNIVCWELWNEVDNIFNNSTLNGNETQVVMDWHKEMNAWIANIDPYKHLVTTSVASTTNTEHLFGNIYKDLDIVQHHKYQNIQKAKSKELTSQKLLSLSLEARLQYPDKPYFAGEYGLKSGASGIDNFSKDPKGIELHNSLWSTTFSGAMGPASFWYWRYLYKQGLFKRFKPIMVFCSQLPMLSDDFTPQTTGNINGNTLSFPNNIETYYLINKTEDTLLGWCQDDAFNYQALRRLTDKEGNNGHFDDNGVFDPKGYVYTLNSEKRPKPSSSRNTINIPIDKQPTGTKYAVRWFDTETGLEMTSEETTAQVRRRWFAGKSLSITFPSSIRDLRRHQINNTFGDAAFIIYKISD